VKQEEIAISPMGKIELPVDRSDQIRPFTPEDVERPFEIAAQTLRPLRYTVILSVLLDTGIRVMELCRLRVSDVDLNRKQMTFPGKGNKEHHCPIWQVPGAR
jgi:integrase